MGTRRTALVTGGAAGIGAGIALGFAEAGYSVAILDVDGDGCRATAAKLQSGSRVLAIEGDVSKESDAARAVEETFLHFGALDVLVNNAGIEVNGTVSELAAEEWDRQIAVNLRGAYLMSRYAIPRMKSGSAIVNISSVHAFVSWSGCAAYDATKSGLIGLTRAMALDHGRDGIRVNAICPGYIDTPLIGRWLSSFSDREEALRQVIACHPVGRIGTPRDIAQAALFLASEAASFISGTSLVVDGAMTAAGH